MPLVERYGAECVSVYLRHHSRIGRVLTVPADGHDRKGFETLSIVGLAARGTEIPLSSILETLTLTEMNELASGIAEKPFTRKVKAVEFLAIAPGAMERLSRNVAFRELFQLKPLPTEFQGLDLPKIIRALDWWIEVGRLLEHTYTAGRYAAQSNVGLGARDVTGWEVLDGRDESSCPFCRKTASKKHPPSPRPKVPLHLGCRCVVLPVF